MELMQFNLMDIVFMTSEKKLPEKVTKFIVYQVYIFYLLID